MAGSLPSSSSNFHLNWAIEAWRGWLFTLRLQTGDNGAGQDVAGACSQVMACGLVWLVNNERMESSAWGVCSLRGQRWFFVFSLCFALTFFESVCCFGSVSRILLFFFFFFCPAVPHFSCFFLALIPSPHLWTLMRPDYLSHYCRARASSCIVVLMNAWTLCSPTSDCSSLKNWFPPIRNGKWTKKKKKIKQALMLQNRWQIYFNKIWKRNTKYNVLT